MFRRKLSIVLGKSYLYKDQSCKEPANHSISDSGPFLSQVQQSILSITFSFLVGGIQLLRSLIWIKKFVLNLITHREYLPYFILVKKAHVFYFHFLQLWIPPYECPDLCFSRVIKLSANLLFLKSDIWKGSNMLITFYKSIIEI